jgi:hypothetical protein
MTNQEIISEIIKLEYEITAANLNGHKPIDGDIYSDKRKRIKELREKLWNIK